ncbi:hypothetical protein M0811_06930 [Anaeramoeba ignava]|uniref:Phosphatidic acid phosphatase type 2/haloperoxidase domain-containing protein n=1 Tax=Anaeramoeba ignava TaxID=1746090 RepID=A0A9Q0LNH7_ANAIG|nr:hypothetical protein M0811_06930 [Anaeramoeba ignava]
MKSLIISIIILLSILQSIQGIKPSCKNQLNNNFFNKCFKQIPLGVGTIYGNMFYQYFNPVTLMTFGVVAIIVLPVIVFGTKKLSSNSSIKKFFRIQFVLLNFVHRLVYAFVLDVMLYTVFRQRRPCICDIEGTGEFSPVGSIYGMPSGDSMTGGLLGSFLFDEAIYFPILSRIVGVVILILAMIERVTLGFHSVGQVVTGGSLGVALYFYSTRVPQYWTLIFDSVFQLVAAIPLLKADSALTYQKDDPNNMYCWILQGFSYLIFDVLVFVITYYHLGWSFLKKSYRKISDSFDSLDLKCVNRFTQELVSENPQENQKYNVVKITGAWFVWIAFFILLCFFYISRSAEIFGWSS